MTFFVAYFCVVLCLPAGLSVKAEGWNLLSSYTTYFNKNEGGRSENIKISASLIDGITLQAYGEFSFNQTVGKRSEKAGFKQAKIIVNGQYVQGVGGGVCQVSTTLYNSALTCGLWATEFHPHSLQVSYVPPSRDAMVSTQSDLKLFNPHDFPVRIEAKVKDGSIKISFYGAGLAYRYKVVSEKIEEIPPPPALIKAGEKEEVLRVEKSGLKSACFLETYKADRLCSRKRLRVDEYRAVQGIIVKKIEEGSN